MRERQLVRPITSSSSSSSLTPQPQASANVIGLLPQEIYSILSSSSSSSSSTLDSTGLVDSTNSSLSLLIQPNGLIKVWPHYTQTLSEDLIVSDEGNGSNGVITLLHPEYARVEGGGGGGGGGGALTSNLVTLAPYGGGVFSSSSSTTEKKRERKGTPHSLYACSPDGVLCLWNDISSSSSSSTTAHPKTCDVSVRLPLYQDEYITCISSSSSSSSRSTNNAMNIPNENDNLVLVGTSHGRIYMALRSARPLELRARLIRSNNIKKEEGEYGEEKKKGGIMGGIYSTLFGSSSDQNEENYMEEEEEEEESSGGEAIHSILRLPTPSFSDKKKAVASFVTIGKRNNLTLSTYSIYSSSSSSSSSSYYYSTQDSTQQANLKEYNNDHIALLRLLQKRMIRESSSSSSSYIPKTAEVLSSSSQFELVSLILRTTGTTTTSTTQDSSSSSSEEKEESRFYVLICQINDSEFIEIKDMIWLSRYSSESINMRSVQCAGSILVQDDIRDGEYDDDDDDEHNGVFVVYAAFHSTLSGNNVGGSGGNNNTPVTITAINLPQRQCHDVDLPSDVVPKLLQNSIGYDTTTIGCVVISVAGVVVNTRVLFPFWKKDKGRRRRMVVEKEEEEEEESGEVVSTLTSHLLSAFKIYQSRFMKKRSGGGGGVSGTTTGGLDSNALSSLLPPSIQAAKSSSVTKAVVSASYLLCNENTSTVDSTTTGNTTTTTDFSNAKRVMAQKSREHANFINFLIHAGIYRRVSRGSNSGSGKKESGGRILLRNHGEIMNAIIGVLNYWQNELEQQQQLQQTVDDGNSGGRSSVGRRSTRSSTRAATAAAAATRKEEQDGSGGVNEAKNHMKKIISKSLAGIEKEVTLLPQKLVLLQKNVLLDVQQQQNQPENNETDDVMMMMNNNDNSNSSSGNVSSWALNQVSSMLCIGLRNALKYRYEKSEILYDLPSVYQSSEVQQEVGGGVGGGDGNTLLMSPSSSSSSSSLSLCKAAYWTCDSDVLFALMNQLKIIQQASSTSSSSSNIGSTTATSSLFAEYRNVKMHVDVLSEVLLNGYSEKLSAGSSSLEEEEESYDEAKKLAIPLVRYYGKGNDSDERKALKMSLIHAYFDGIVNICYDYQRKEKRGGAGATAGKKGGRHRSSSSSSSDREGGGDDKNPYNLYPMLSSRSEDDPHGLYRALNQVVDYSSKLTFRHFVLKWYADRGLYADVLDLGAVCPDVLSRYLQEDGRLREYRWIHSVRTGDFQGATSCLVGLASSGGIHSSFEESKLVLSLGRIANKIAKTDNDELMNDGESKEKTAEEKIMDNNLSLIRSQEMLRDNAAIMEHEDIEKFEQVLSAEELLQIAIDQSADADNVEGRVVCLIIGLAIAEVIQNSSSDDGAWNAARVWMTSIMSDMETWKNLAADGRSLISDGHRSRYINGTVFYGLASQYYGSKRERMIDIGFLSNMAVVGHTVAELNLDEQTEALLKAAADIAAQDVRG